MKKRYLMNELDSSSIGGDAYQYINDWYEYYIDQKGVMIILNEDWGSIVKFENDNALKSFGSRYPRVTFQVYNKYSTEIRDYQSYSWAGKCFNKINKIKI